MPNNIGFQVASPQTIKQAKNVIVLGAGPSVKKALPIVREWRRQHTAVVIGACYPYGLPTDYTFFVATKTWIRFQEKIKSKMVIATSCIKPGWYKNYKKRKLLLLKTERLRTHKINHIDIDRETGHVKHDPANAGFGAILLATFCNPQNMLIAGFDGFTEHKDQIITKRFNRTKKVWAKDLWKQQEVVVREKAYFQDLVLPYVESLGITIHAFKFDPLRHIDTSKLHINFLE